MDNSIINELTKRYHKSTARCSFIALHMNETQVISRVLSVFQIIDGGYVHTIDVTVEQWTDLSMLRILEKCTRATPSTQP